MLDDRRAVATYANAGHNPPLLVRTGGEAVWLSTGGTVLGVFPDAQYVEGQTTLGAGDRLVLYTDGITEARNGMEEEFGERRLADAVVRHRLLDAASLHSEVLRAVNDFTDGVFQDDATLIVVAIASSAHQLNQ
jgi:sigma-B regulation protein RsbU (phosphoserine phosphatase)